ncbi:hypothetical protein [Saccharothrix variisporea]|uniref:Uncharacterized protein n=1 Tax=Saccharothrix variisporea TaxID=543527 RepID=A0A495XGE5_9PSEU|nr:hypothetical protein [Saccharothrix variisporea]RKT73370.1 hypothetical protein DFJ66_6702 [Saccharothrix variisporea]
METKRLVAVGADGVIVPLTLEIVVDGEPALIMELPGEGRRSFTGADYFLCLIDVRRELEHYGLLLCCQGARADVFPSGMQSQVELGRYARVLTREPEKRAVVDIFDPADVSEAATLEAQKIAVYEFFGLPMGDSPDGD